MAETGKKYNVYYNGDCILQEEVMTAIPYYIVEHYMKINKDNMTFEQFKEKFNMVNDILPKSQPLILEESEIGEEEDTSGRRKTNYIRTGRELLVYSYDNTVRKFGVLTQWANDNKDSNFAKFITKIKELGYKIEQINKNNEKNYIFEEMYNCVQGILNEKGVNIGSIDNYDGIIIKQLSATNTLDSGKSGKQYHIAITGNQMDIFPYLRSDGYFNSKSEIDKELKKYFALSIPAKINKSNYEYLKCEDDINNITFNSEFKNEITHIVRSKRKDGSEQMQISLIKFDSSDFIKFRKLIHSDDYLIVLKIKEKFLYEFYGVKKVDADINEFSLKQYNGKFGWMPRNTFINVEELDIDEEKKEICRNHKLAENRIYYGAPGTGKSHTVDEIAHNEFDISYRTTFYPEYTHDDFVGSFMPVMNYEVQDPKRTYVHADGTTSDIAGKPVPYYTFVPGPFTDALVDTMNNPEKNVLLIIEELNRANAAAVFGEIFQLLDRKYGGKDTDGESRYEVNISNEFSEYLSSKVTHYNIGNKIKIPRNLSIYATMNSADQGVNPLDSAFKRRWNFKYVNIDFEKAEHKDSEIVYAGRKLTWKTFGQTINEKLVSLNINEDKLLGEYFINPVEIKDADKFVSKVISYLFDDVFKFNRREFFKSDFKTFSQLKDAFAQKEIFSFEFEYEKEESAETDYLHNEENLEDLQLIADPKVE